MTKIFIFAGEPSGDLHGSCLIKALREWVPDSEIAGVAGPRMRAEGLKVLIPSESFEVMGFSDVFAALPSLWKQFCLVRNAILAGDYKVVVLIDYPGFNLRLAQALRKKGFKGKIVQYISPTVWAHGRSRIRHMAKTLDLLLTIYPFEAACFAKTSLPVVYIGNPLQERLGIAALDPQWREKVGLDASDEFVAIFPGSRGGEVKRNLSVQLKAAVCLKKTFPTTRFAISCTHPDAKRLIKQALEATDPCFQKDIVLIPKEFTYEAMRECRTAIAKSGTVTLELALRQCPTLVTYLISPLNKFIAKYVLRVKLSHYCIVNILSRQTVFPEFIDSKLSLKKMVQELHALHSHGTRRDSCISQCAEIKDLLGEHASSNTAAKSIAQLLK